VSRNSAAVQGLDAEQLRAILQADIPSFRKMPRLEHHHQIRAAGEGTRGRMLREIVERLSQ